MAATEAILKSDMGVLHKTGKGEKLPASTLNEAVSSPLS
jgi:hypothetical protein